MRYAKILPCLFLVAACQDNKTVLNGDDLLVEAFDADDVTATESDELTASWEPVELKVESPEHPYANNADIAFDSFDGGMSGVRQFSVHFSRLDTEAGYDYVEIYNQDYVRIARYSGKATYGFWTKALTARSISFRFVSDKSKVKWGFSIDKARVTGCTTKATCGTEKGWKCEKVTCITTPCFNHCDFNGPLCGTRGAKACDEPKKCIGGNPAVDVPGECVPEQYCEYASDCSNLMAPKCWGWKWRCDTNFCEGSCGNLDAGWNDCASDADCARGESCVDTGKRCITTPCYGVYQCQAQGQQEGETCGGIASLQCAAGLDCFYGDVGGTENDCSVADRGGTCIVRPTECILRLYAPTCGCDGKTYPNVCELQLAGVAFSHSGECGPPQADVGQTCGGIASIQCKPGLECDYGPAPGPRTNHDTKAESQCQIADVGGTCVASGAGFCTAQYDPVCGCDGKTYSNDCARSVAGAQFGYWGQCKP